MNFSRLIVAFATVGSALILCAEQATLSPRDLMAIVNGETITAAELDRVVEGEATALNDSRNAARGVKQTH